MELQGKEITLKEITIDDIEMIREWRNKYSSFFFNSSYITKEQQMKWFSKYKNSVLVEYMWIILDNNYTPCGTISLYNISFPSASATVGRMLLLEDSKYKGIMEDALNTVCKYANQIGISRLTLSVYMDNLEAIKLYSKCGFKTQDRPVILMERTYEDMSGCDYESTCDNIR